MLTLGRFRSMTESYGADLDRWPEQARADARALLSVSAEARTMLEGVRALDDLIETTHVQEDGLLWQPGEQDAALVRLRAGVAARIAALPARPPRATDRMRAWLRGGAAPARLRWLGLATGGACAIICGLLIGGRYESAPTSPGVLNQMLRPAVLEILPD
jgi:hypothetical protein